MKINYKKLAMQYMQFNPPPYEKPGLLHHYVLEIIQYLEDQTEEFNKIIRKRKIAK